MTGPEFNDGLVIAGAILFHGACTNRSDATFSILALLGMSCWALASFEYLRGAGFIS